MVFTDLAKQRKGVNVASIALWCGSCSYIVCIFQAVGLSMHYQVTGYPLPSPQSQVHVGATITVMRACTFLFGNLLGVLTLKVGRRTMMWSALFIGYIPTFIFFLIGWLAKPNYWAPFAEGTAGRMGIPCESTAMPANFNWTGIPKIPCTVPGTMYIYYAGYVICGIFAPYFPHAMGYIADISTPETMVKNQAKVQSLGYFLGLAFGYVIALGILLGVGPGSMTTTPKYHGNFITVSLIAGMVIVLIGTATICIRLDESLPVEERPKQLPWFEANPLRIFTVCMKNNYLACIMGYLFTANIGAAASEAIIGTFYAVSLIKTYGAKYLVPLLIFIMLVFFCNAFSAIVMGPLYQRKMGFKNAFHFCIFFSIIFGGLPLVLMAATQNAVFQWVAVVGNLLFTGCILPYQTSLFMGQAENAADKATFSGIYRTVQAFGKAIGALIGGVFLAPPWVASMTDALYKGKTFDGAYFLPFFVYMLMPFLAWMCFIIGEICFKDLDQQGWKSENDNGKGFTDAMATKKSMTYLTADKKSTEVEAAEAS